MSFNINQRLNGLHSLAYLGDNSVQPPNFVTKPRPPNSTDSKNFALGDIWLDTTGYPTTLPKAENVWMLVALVGNVAKWVNFAGGTSAVEKIGGNTGVALPIADEIDIKTANATPIFAAATNQVVLDFFLLNLALGSSLPAITSGQNNLCYGPGAGNSLTSGSRNVFLGYGAGQNATTTIDSIAIGNTALFAGGGINGKNVAIGYLTLAANTGNYNTAIGYGSAEFGTGSNNISIGYQSGEGWSAAESDNIAIGSQGVNGESSTTRVGTNGTQTKCLVAGIEGVNLTTAKVVTIASDQLGSASITAGSGIAVDSSVANVIKISATAGGFAWSVITSNASIVAENGYMVGNKGSLLTMTLPASATLGDTFIISNYSNIAVGWRVAQLANQQIRSGTSQTTLGVTGYLEATQLGDTIECTCVVGGASSIWQVISKLGTITVS